MTYLLKHHKYPVLVVFLILFGLSSVVFPRIPVSMRASGSGDAPMRVQPLIFFDETLFWKGVKDAGNKIHHAPYSIKGGIIPHHLLPGYILSDFFATLAEQKPKIIMLIGPNHYERGSFDVLTSDIAWKTPFGNVLPEREAIKTLEARNFVRTDNETVSLEHSVAGIMSYIRYYLPETTVVPLVVSHRIPDENIDVLAKFLSSFLTDDGVVFVASVDFSHYLTRDAAREKDRMTESLLRSRDYRALLMLGNDYLDSPASIVLLMKIMDLAGHDELAITHHTNSGELLKDPSAQTTSYYAANFY